MPNKKINALDARTAVSTDLMLVGDPSTGTAYKSTVANLPLVPTSRTLTINGVAFDLSANRAWTLGTVTSVGLTMPSAFGVANSPITSSGTLAVTALGSASQYIRGDGVLATLPTGGSGGSSISYYLNGGIAASVGTYFQMSTTPVVGTNADFTRTGNGLISQFLTDAGDPNRLQIPAGNWNFEMFFSMSSSGGTPQFYVELLKYDGTTFTSIASSSVIPEEITGGTNIDLYLTSLAIPATTLLTTDRLALRVYIVNNSGGRTATLHTQDSHLCQIITNFAGGISALNGLTANTQYFATGTSGTNFGISSVLDTHTFNLPTASATNRGALSSADWSTFNGKVSGNGVANQLTYWNGTGNVTGSSNLVWDNTNNRLGIGTATPAYKLEISTTSGTSSAGLLIKNTGAGITDFASLNFANNSTLQTQIFATSSNFTTAPLIGANGFGNYTNGAGGLTLWAENGAIKFAAGSDGALGSQKMTLFTNGNLSINTANSDFGFKFNVNGTARVSGDFTTNLTLGSIPFIGASGVLTQSNSNLFWDNGNSRLGIGITTPLFKLDVNGTSRLNGDIRTNLNPSSVLFINAFGDIGQSANFFWDYTNNNLGIGTNTPSITDSISIVGSSNARKSIVIQNTNTLGNASFYFQNNRGSFASYGGLLHGGATYATTFFGLSGADKTALISDGANSTGLMIGTLVSANVIFGTNNAERMRLTAAGRLLLGTVSESTNILEVNGTARIQDNLSVTKNHNGLTFVDVTNTSSGSANTTRFGLTSDAVAGGGGFGKNSSTYPTYKVISSSDMFFYNGTGGDITIFNDFASGKVKFTAGAASTAQMTLTSAGRLLLGTTSESTNILEVLGTARISSNLTLTSLTAGSIPFIGASGLISQNNSNLFWDNTNARLGIGTATPSYDIHIEKNRNAATTISVSNTTSDTNSNAGVLLISDTNSGSFNMFKVSTLYTTYKTIVAKDAGYYNAGGGDFSFLNDHSTGKFKWAMGASSTAQMTLTAAGSLLVGGTTESTSAIVRLDSTTKGFLPPRLTTTQKNAIATPAAGLMVYDTTLNKLCVYTTAWEVITSL